MKDLTRTTESELEPVAAPPAPAPAPAGAVQRVLALQRSAGNQAVAGMLARNLDPGVPSDDQAFDDAVKAGDWPKAAATLVKLPSATPKLSPLTVDQLRLLEDAVIRGGIALGGMGSVVLMAIGVALAEKGVAAGKTAAGAAYGKLEHKIDEHTDGDKATGAAYALGMRITFTPDAAAVDADEIAFIQTVRLVETRTGANKDPDATNQKRQTKDNTSVDRLAGKEQGWYGMSDAGGGGGNLTAWKKTDPATPATMHDRPSASLPGTTWQFETMVVAKSGNDAGKVYAVVTWGFTVDDDLKLTELPRTVTNKQTDNAKTAVGNWNAQAAGPAADRNAPGQKTLPGLK